MILMKRGRPVKSTIRQNIVTILSFIQQGYGYDIYKIYRDVFPHCTQKSIYYHLKKGIATGEFVVQKIEKEKGNFSWGSEVEKIYYALGPSAHPGQNTALQSYFADRKKRVNI